MILNLLSTLFLSINWFALMSISRSIDFMSEHGGQPKFGVNWGAIFITAVHWMIVWAVWR